MNTGLQDAANLGWKLALALQKPEVASSILSTYEIERRPVAQWVLDNSDAAFSSVINPLSSWKAILRKWLIWTVLYLAPRGSLPSASFRDKMYGISISYKSLHTSINSGFSPPRGALEAGDRLPNVICTVRGVKGALAGLHSILGPLSLSHHVIFVARNSRLLNPLPVPEGIPKLKRTVFAISNTDGALEKEKRKGIEWLYQDPHWETL